MAPVERLDLYHRQYWYRVLDSLEEDFPALKALLGDDRFRTLLEDYLEVTPSRSCTLRHLGSQLPSYLASHPHLAGRHAATAIELARLEYALCLAFEAEERQPAGVEQMESARLSLQPHVQLFALRTTADELWNRSVRSEGDPRSTSTPTATASRFVVVFRDGFVPTMQTVEAEAFRLLSALRDGATLAEAIESSGLDADGAEAEAGNRLQRWFAEWTTRGWLVPAS